MPSHFQLQAKEVKSLFLSNLRFSQKWVKPSFSDPNAPNSDSKIIFICAFSERSIFFSAHFWTTAAASQVVDILQAQHFSFVNIHIELSITWVQTSEILFSNPCWWKQKNVLTNICEACIRRALVSNKVGYIITKYVLVRFTQKSVMSYRNV